MYIIQSEDYFCNKGIYRVCIAGIHTASSFMDLLVSKAEKTLVSIFSISTVLSCTYLIYRISKLAFKPYTTESESEVGGSYQRCCKYSLRDWQWI